MSKVQTSKRRFVAIAFFSTLFTLILCEIIIRVLAHQGLIRISHFPTTTMTDRFLGDIDPNFGVWHYPNRTIRHTSPCFDVTYESNSYGARDIERTESASAPGRVVVLGDSFVEGFGVRREERLTEIAEQLTGRELLNFGVSGNFGSIQQWLLYKNLAAKFDHDQIALFHLPANDFEDNNPDFSPSKRYRPYFRRADTGEFEIYYTVEFEDRQQPPTMKRGRIIRRNLYNNIYILNLIRQVGEMIESSSVKEDLEEAVDRRTIAYYDNYGPTDLEHLLHSYRLIAEHAYPRQLTIFIIPTIVDLLAYQQDGYDFRIVSDLDNFAKQFDNIKIVDLLPEFAEYAEEQSLEFDDFSLPCDAHWSALGHQVAAQVLADSIHTDQP